MVKNTLKSGTVVLPVSRLHCSYIQTGLQCSNKHLRDDEDVCVGIHAACSAGSTRDEEQIKTQCNNQLGPKPTAHSDTEK